MNRILSGYYPTFAMYQALRHQLMGIITDADLCFQINPATPTLGALCQDIGETEYTYIQSFTTFTQDFAYRATEPGLATSVAALTAWYATLDHDLKAAVERLTDDDIANRVIDRGGGFILPPQAQLEVYKEALLIFCGKVSIYLKVLGKTLPEQWQEWLG